MPFIFFRNHLFSCIKISFPQKRHCNVFSNYIIYGFQCNGSNLLWLNFEKNTYCPLNKKFILAHLDLVSCEITVL